MCVSAPYMINVVCSAAGEYKKNDPGRKLGDFNFDVFKDGFRKRVVIYWFDFDYFSGF